MVHLSIRSGGEGKRAKKDGGLACRHCKGDYLQGLCNSTIRLCRIVGIRGGLPFSKLFCNIVNRDSEWPLPREMDLERTKDRVLRLRLKKILEEGFCSLD